MPGSDTWLHDVPPLVERNSPSRHAANTSFVEFASPLTTGCIEMSHVICALRWVQRRPPSLDSKSPTVVAARR